MIKLVIEKVLSATLLNLGSGANEFGKTKA